MTIRVPEGPFMMNHYYPFTIMVIRPRDAIYHVSNKGSHAFKIKDGNVCIASTFKDSFRFISSYKTSRFPKEVVLFHVVTSVIQIVWSQGFLFLIGVMSVLSHCSVRIEVTSNR